MKKIYAATRFMISIHITIRRQAIAVYWNSFSQPAADWYKLTSRTNINNALPNCQIHCSVYAQGDSYRRR